MEIYLEESLDLIEEGYRARKLCIVDPNRKWLQKTGKTELVYCQNWPMGNIYSPLGYVFKHKRGAFRIFRCYNNKRLFDIITVPGLAINISKRTSKILQTIQNIGDSIGLVFTPKMDETDGMFADYIGNKLTSQYILYSVQRARTQTRNRNDNCRTRE